MYMYIHVHFNYRATEIIFNIPELFNYINFLNSNDIIKNCSIRYSDIIEQIWTPKNQTKQIWSTKNKLVEIILPYIIMIALPFHQNPLIQGLWNFIILEETLFFYFIAMHLIQRILTQGQRRRFSKNDCIHLEPHLNTRTLDTGTIHCIFLELQTHSFSK